MKSWEGTGWISLWHKIPKKKVGTRITTKQEIEIRLSRSSDWVMNRTINSRRRNPLFIIRQWRYRRAEYKEQPRNQNLLWIKCDKRCYIEITVLRERLVAYGIQGVKGPLQAENYGLNVTKYMVHRYMKEDRITDLASPNQREQQATTPVQNSKWEVPNTAWASDILLLMLGMEKASG